MKQADWSLGQLVSAQQGVTLNDQTIGYNNIGSEHSGSPYHHHAGKGTNNWRAEANAKPLTVTRTKALYA